MSTWEKLLGFFWPEGLWPPLRHPVGSTHAICLHSVSLLNQEKENVPQNQAASLCEVLWHSWAKIVAVGIWANPLIATRWVCECNWNLIVPLESRCHTTNTICPSICSSETEAQPANWTHKCKAYFHQLCLVFSYKPQHLSDTPTCKQLPYTHTQSHSEREERRASARWDIESDDITNHRDNQDGVISKPWTNRLLTTTTRRDDGNHFLKDLLLYTIRQNIYPAYYFMTKCCMLMRCYNKYMIPVMYAELRRDEKLKERLFWSVFAVLYGNAK